MAIDSPSLGGHVLFLCVVKHNGIRGIVIDKGMIR